MTPEELKLLANLQAQVNRIQGVVEKLIDNVAKLQIANNIQNTINRMHDISSESNKEDISDSSIGA